MIDSLGNISRITNSESVGCSFNKLPKIPYHGAQNGIIVLEQRERYSYCLVSLRILMTLPMGTDALTSKDIDDANSESASEFLLEALVSRENNGVEESRILMEVLTILDMKLAYLSDRLANLDLYRMIVSLGEFSFEISSTLDVEIEKALVFDLSLVYLDSEVTELGRFMNTLRSEIIDAHKKLHSLRQRTETYTAFQEKLHASEDSWKHVQDELSELERRLVNMRGTPFSQISTYPSEDAIFEGSRFDLQNVGEQRLVLWMLNKSITEELDLERQLLESKEREEELESFVEVALEKLLEAEHSSEIYMGITKEMMTRLQSLQFNIHCSDRREGELKRKLQSTLDQLIEKEIALLNMENSFSELNLSFEGKEGLEEKIKILEGKLEISESMLQEVNASYDVSQDQLSLMENTVKTLRDHVFMTESRVQSVEEKLSTITEENIELREELTFLKGGDDNVDKISLLEKQVRELEAQLQTARTSCDASLEQQNMLYTAIWDMETLIEELRSKVSRAENRADDAEKQCLDLAEINMKLNKEISFLKSNSEKFEFCMKEANEINIARMDDISSSAKLITEVVVQLTSERERIQNQLSSLARENKILLEELWKRRKICGEANEENKVSDIKDSGGVVVEPDTRVSREISTIEDVMETSTSTNQVEESADQNIRHEAESEVGNVTANEVERKAAIRHINKKLYMFAAIIVLLLSMLAMNINWQDIYAGLQ